jgi:hypothetical protein
MTLQSFKIVKVVEINVLIFFHLHFKKEPKSLYSYQFLDHLTYNNLHEFLKIINNSFPFHRFLLLLQCKFISL